VQHSTALVACSGHTELARLLLQAGAAAGCHCSVALHAAAATGHSECVQLLLEHGFAVDSRTSDAAATPLMATADRGRTAAAQCLLAAGADVQAADARGTSALHYAARAGYADTIIMLLAAGAQVDCL
jgi:uncharacterized protein